MSGTDGHDDAFAGLLAGAEADTAAASRWSSFIMPGHGPDATVKAPASPVVAPPKITARSVAPLGQNDPEADYSLVGRLGEGGMGVVFEARQQHLERTVALKMIRPERANDPQAQNSFFYEAVITAGLKHPGIVHVLEFGRTREGRVFYAMQKASGVPWSQILRDKSLPDNLNIFNRVADVVAYAHANGVIHRDLKPGNVLLGEFGEVWVSDWGVAVRRNADGNYSHAYPGGTPQYMPPEQARWEAARQGPASDVYLLGGILFEVLTGRPPHAGTTPLAALANAAGNRIQTTSQAHGLVAIAYQAMEESPEWRFPDVQSLQKAIWKCLAASESGNLLQKAGAQLAEAEREGSYDLFQQAIASYDAALKADPDNPAARRGRAKALIAYGNRALDGNEYDLARSIIETEIPNNPLAAELAKSITKEKAKARRRPWRWRFANTTLGLVALAFLLGGWYVLSNWGNLAYNSYRSRGKSDSYYYLDISKELAQLTGQLRAVEHNARVGKQDALLARIIEVKSVLEECQGRIAAPETATPSTIKQSCDYLYSLTSDLNDRFEEIGEISGELPDGALKRSVSYAKDNFAKMLRLLNAYRVSESK